MTIKKTFDLAVQNHKKNNFQVAENLYKEVLKILKKNLMEKKLLHLLEKVLDGD